MTVEEIFSQISDHMVQGIMFHAQMSDYYNFLGLKGYAACHEYHFVCENYNFRKLNHYYLEHYNKLIQELPTENPKVIPSPWFKYSKQDVDANTRKTAIQSGMENWVKWENSTKEFYQNMYKELIALNEIAGAMEIKKYILDVDYELAEAKEKHIERKAIDYDITVIMPEQGEIYKKYKKKIREVELK